jgi:hypothetical protein
MHPLLHLDNYNDQFCSDTGIVNLVDGTHTRISVSRRSPNGSHATFSIQRISSTYKDVQALKEAKAAKTIRWRTLDSSIGRWGDAAPSDDAMEVDSSPIGSPTKSPPLSAKEEKRQKKFALATFTDKQQTDNCEC